METTMRVQLIGCTALASDHHNGPCPRGQGGTCVCVAATQQCYHKGNYEFDSMGAFDPELILRVADSGHTSVLEHASASFLVSGISRALSLQLVRHRIASYTQQSQRYVNMSDFDYVVPTKIRLKPASYKRFKRCMEYLNNEYKELCKELADEDGTITQEVKEDARAILPNACATQLVVTMNFRQFGHYFGERMCMRAQSEHRLMASEMFRQLSKLEPSIFGTEGVFKGAKCQNLGYCPEAKGCGMKPMLKSLIK